MNKLLVENSFVQLRVDAAVYQKTNGWIGHRTLWIPSLLHTRAGRDQHWPKAFRCHGSTGAARRLGLRAPVTERRQEQRQPARGLPENDKCGQSLFSF